MKTLTKPLSLILFSTGISLSLSSGLEAKTPTSLHWKNFDEVANYVSLKNDDEVYQNVTWHNTVLAGHQQAQIEDKPILLWLYFGDPRANC